MSGRVGRRPSLGANVASNYAGHAVAVVTGIAITPLLLGALGPSLYGVWVLILSIQGLAGLLDLGVTAGIVKYVAEHEARGETPRRNAVVATGTMLHLVVGVIACLSVATIALMGLPLLALSPVELEEARTALLVVAVGLLVALPLSVPGSLLVGLRRFDSSNAISIAQTLIGLGLTILALWWGAGPAVLAAINALMVTAGFLVKWAYARRLLPDLDLSPRLADRSTLRSIARYSGWLFLVDAGRTLFYSADAVLIAAFLPISAVGTFNIGFKPASAISYLAGPMAGVLIPQAAHLDARQDASALQRLLTDGSRAAVALTLMGAVWLWTFGDLMIALWVGPGHAAAVPVLWIMLGVFVLGSVQSSASAVLRGTGRVRPFALTVLAEYVGNIGLTIALLPVLGIAGAALGSLLPAIVADLIVIPFLACQTAQVSYPRFLRVVLGPALLSSLVAALVLLALRSVLDTPTLGTALISGVVATATFAIMFWLIGLRASERTEVRARLADIGIRLSSRRAQGDP